MFSKLEMGPDWGAGVGLSGGTWETRYGVVAKVRLLRYC